MSRFTASRNVAVAGQRGRSARHRQPRAPPPATTAARIHFGPDGKLYIAVGENATVRQLPVADQPAGQDPPHQSRRLHPRRQPVLQPGDRRQPGDLGAGPAQPVHLRLPARHRRRMFINDVGENTWEEIDDGIAGSNYGWPTYEGPSTPRATVHPLFAYPHNGAEARPSRAEHSMTRPPCSSPTYVQRRLLLRRLPQRLDPHLQFVHER